MNFMSSKDLRKTRTIHSRSDNIEIMIGSETLIIEIIDKPFEFRLQKYKKGLEESMNGSEFVFDSVHLLHYKYHKISLNCSGSYIDSPKWLKKTNKKQQQ